MAWVGVSELCVGVLSSMAPSEGKQVIKTTQQGGMENRMVGRKDRERESEQAEQGVCGGEPLD